MKILFLYSEYVGYLDGLMKALVKNYGANICIVSWDEKLLKPPTSTRIQGVRFEKRSQFESFDLVELIEDFEPEIVYISGWMDKGYLDAVNKTRNRQQFTTVCGFDDNWLGTIRQVVGAAYFRFSLRKFFDKAWVAGARQYHYARQLGYKDPDIAFNLLSCNSGLFDDSVNIDLNKQNKDRRFFYVGNFRDVKGTDLLADAYRYYRNVLSGACELVCIGSGPMQGLLENESGISVFPYMASSELLEATNSLDIFVLPSRRDQWGVVLHEFALRGFPLLSSKGAGATDQFLLDGYNGLMFRTGDSKNLAYKLREYEDMPVQRLDQFGKRSRCRGQAISSETSAASLISLANREKQRCSNE